jgi:hypothetical protein
MTQITGDEPYYAFTVDRGLKVQINEGATLKQVVLKDFMCALVQSNYNPRNLKQVDTESIAHKANQLTTAYISQLNKTTS